MPTPRWSFLSSGEYNPQTAVQRVPKPCAHERDSHGDTPAPGLAARAPEPDELVRRARAGWHLSNTGRHQRWGVALPRDSSYYSIPNASAPSQLPS